MSVASALQVVIAVGVARLRLAPFVNFASDGVVCIGKHPHRILVHAGDTEARLSPQVDEAV